jgi:hypothetical protein
MPQPVWVTVGPVAEIAPVAGISDGRADAAAGPRCSPRREAALKTGLIHQPRLYSLYRLKTDLTELMV